MSWKKRTDFFRAWTVKCCVALVIVFLNKPVAAQIYDDFASSTINNELWNIYDPAHVLSESNGFLQASGPPHAQYAHLTSKVQLSGNLTIIMTFQNFSSTASSFQNNVPQLGIVLHVGSNHIGIYRGYFSNGHQFFSNKYKDGTWLPSAGAAASTSSGQLKIEISGTTASLFFRERTEWILLDKDEQWASGPSTFQINVYTGDNGNFSASVDQVEVINGGLNIINVHYDLRIEDPSSGNILILMHVNNISSEFFEIEEHGYQGLYVNVISLKAYTLSGSTLSVIHLPDSGTSWQTNIDAPQQADVWKIQCSGERSIVVEYLVRPGLIGRYNGHRGYVGPDFAVFAGEHVFLVPRGSVLNSMTVAFSVPLGWHVYTPWTRTKKTYDITSNNMTTIDNLSNTVIALGHFDLYRRRIANTKFAVAVYGMWPLEMKKEIAKTAATLFDYFTKVFTSDPGGYYLAVFCPKAIDEQHVYGGEWSTSQGFSIEIFSDGSYWPRWDVFAHQLFHRWNGFAWGMAGYHAWFVDGPDRFYELKTMERFGTHSPWLTPEQQISQYWTKYLTEYVAKGIDLPMVYQTTDPFLIYDKGALVTFLIAKEIVQRTNNTVNMDTFLTLLFNKYGFYKQPCDEECLKRELNVLTDSDFTEFFDKYIYGSETLPFDWAFADDDGDGLSNFKEICWDTNPSVPDTDSDGYNDLDETQHGSDPVVFASTPGISINQGLFRYWPCIDANGSDTPLQLDSTDELEILIRNQWVDLPSTIELWVAAETPFGFFFWDGAQWQETMLPSYHGPFNNDVAFRPLKIIGLPKVKYTIYYAIDTYENNLVDINLMYLDWLHIHIQ